ncbi:MAG: thiol reductant ABC exporter subunit CydD [Gammaproteobacteria bacterium RIFCSPHIGHO2_12_FULL_40_19]|nr:MAG: thiol reductant ABC exporter subunit CydD [Gammaproteobacteria bacterium RIFCSPHIGHO2_12_FULL_40_19]
MRNKGYQFLIKNSKPAHRWLFLSITLGIASGLLIVLQSGILATVIDRVYLHHATRDSLFGLLYFFLLIIFLRASLTWAREMVSFQTAKHVKDVVRHSVFSHLLQLSPTQLSRLKTGELTSTLIEHIEALHGFFSDYLPQMTIAVILPFIIMIVVFSQNWIAGCILLLTAPLIVLFMALIGMGTHKLNQENFQTLSQMSAHFLDRLQGLTTLVLFNRAHAQLHSIETTSHAYREKTMRILRIAFLSTATLELFSTVAIAIIAIYLGLGLLGSLKIGFSGVLITLQHALFILLLAPEFFMPLRQLGTFYHARSEAIGAADALMSILNEPIEDHTSGNKSACVSNLKFENIHFSYHSHQKILNNFNVTFNPGECVAIAGPSGVGKSTVLHLIAKFLTPESGKIIINDTHLNDINNDHWREHIAFLHQHPRLFYGTIADNIRFANQNATQDEIEAAARISGVLDFTRYFPEGLNTMIGEQNAGLSGGQTQRIALARIHLKNAPIILLDEPTAHLDQENTAIILKLLTVWRSNKTVIIASHDEALLKHMDRIITLA